jgi:hypothetical protein
MASAWWPVARRTCKDSSVLTLSSGVWIYSGEARKADPSLRPPPAKMPRARDSVRDDTRIFVSAELKSKFKGKSTGRIAYATKPNLFRNWRLGDVSSLPCIEDPEAMGGFFAVQGALEFGYWLLFAVVG